MLVNAFEVSLVLMLACAAMWNISWLILNPIIALLAMFVIFTLSASTKFSLSFVHMKDFEHEQAWRLMLDTTIQLAVAIATSVGAKYNLGLIVKELSKPSESVK